MPGYWLPESDSPQHVIDADLRESQREAQASMRMLAGVFLYCAGVVLTVTLVSLACKAYDYDGAQIAAWTRQTVAQMRAR